MDRVEFVTPSSWLKVGLLAMVASLCVACADEGSPPDEGVGHVAPIDLETARTAMDPTDFDVIESFDTGVPSSIPDHAVALAAFVAGQYDDSPGQKPEFIVASLRPTDLDLYVVCVGMERQISCSGDADAWSVSFSDPGAAVIDISGTATVEAAALLLSASGDDERPQLVSRGFWIDPPGDIPASSGEVFRHEPVYGGCGFAVIASSLTPKATFTPLTSSTGLEDLYLLVQTCEDETASSMIPFLIVNQSRGHTLASSEGDPGAITISPGSSYVIPLRMTDLEGATEIQIFVLLDSQSEAWVTWPVSLTG